MAGIVVVGAQWGDEGKGKIVDLLSKKADAVVRYQGGNNAGHTVYHGIDKFSLSSLPASIVSSKALSIIGNGVVINPKAFFQEEKKLKEKGVNTDKLKISDRAQVIMPYHIEIDRLSEKANNSKIGTTQKGIGPCYSDKINRQGIRVVDLINPEIFSNLLKEYLPLKNLEIEKLYGGSPLNYQDIYQSYVKFGKRLKPYVIESDKLSNYLSQSNKNIVFEGAQGVMLDIDQGTYPYVTSSNPTSGGSAVGAGIGAEKITDVIGVIKAYTSRVGKGPFPTELKGKTGDFIRKKGHEYGVVTKRPRRIGWIDIVALKHAMLVSGASRIALNSLDVLSGISELKIAKAYKIHGKLINIFPSNINSLTNIKPVYETLSGWSEDLSGINKFNDLPHNAQIYVKEIEKLLNIPIFSFGVGPHFEQTHLLKKIWK